MVRTQALREKNVIKNMLCFWALFLTLSLQHSITFAQGEPAYPARRITYVVPSTPGAGADFPPRVIADKLTKSLGQPVVVENRPGASWTIGTEYVTRQPADGYTILHVAQLHVLNPSFMPRLPYDPIKDFDAVTHAVSTIFVMTLHPSMPAKNLQEFIALARANPGKYTYGSVGSGSSHHLGGALLEAITGIKMLHVPFKGGSQIVQALIAGQIDATFISVFPVTKFIQSGKLRGLAVTTTFRSSLLPEAPTMEEAAGLKGYDMDVWQGVLTRAGTPRPVILRLNREINAIVQDKAEAQRLREVGYEPAGGTPEQFTELMKTELAKWSRIIRDAGIKPEFN